jgi:hypothetical protein
MAKLKRALWTTTGFIATLGRGYCIVVLGVGYCGYGGGSERCVESVVFWGGVGGF